MARDRLSAEDLDDLERLSRDADPGPWKAMVEGRDHTSGDSFIQVGSGEARKDDIYVSRERVAARPIDLDLIAAARNALPLLLAEVRVSRSNEAAQPTHDTGYGSDPQEPAIDVVQYLFRCGRDGQEMRQPRLGGSYSPVKMATSDSGDFVFLMADDCKAWDEVGSIVERLLGPRAKPRDVAYAFDAALAATVDPDPGGLPYRVGARPLCTLCGDPMEMIDVASPLVVVRVRPQAATHLAWYRLHPERRLQVVADAIKPWMPSPGA